MKHSILFAAMLLILASCQNGSNNEGIVTYKFNIIGDFNTRGELVADGSAMTDIWVLDYMNNTFVQQIHQSSSDADFGSPVITLRYGDHHLYFVASRGKNPSIDINAGMLTFSSASDTFWKDYELSVESGNAGNVSVVLNRIVSKLRIVVGDAVPEGAASFNITPHTWYRGFNYMTGSPTSALTDNTSVISIPSSVIGTTDVTVSLFSFSPSTEWTTNIVIAGKNSSGEVIGSATASNVPFVRNRITSLSGNLFSQVNTSGITLNTEWESPTELSW